VVLGHIVLFAGLSRVGFPDRLGDMASVSVEVFIIVSGFVITHLLLTRREAYLPYIAKRFFRLFPAFVACAAAGAAAIAVSRTPWPSDPTYQYGLQLAALKDAEARHLTAHVLLHLTMLHGMFPNNVLNVSQWALLPTAWSASLEWQFYLVAPVVVLLFRRKGGAILVALLTIGGLWSYGHGYLGTFESPSILPGAAEFFLLGIASRFCWGEIKVPAPASVAIAILTIGYLTQQMAIGLWLAFLTYMFRAATEATGADRWLLRAGDALFASRTAEWAGKRTYSVYLVHYPIFQLLLTAMAFAGLRSPAQVAGLLLILGFPLTALVAEVVHRCVELPGIELGREIARRLSLEGRDAIQATA
jgi:peptidoglycan/LPS O-acetylase OafA/YrhL